MKRFQPTRFLALLATACAAFALTPSFAQAQSNVQFQVANLAEDLRLLEERLRYLSLEIEELRRENGQLRDAVRRSEAQIDSQLSKFATVGQLNESIRKAVASLEAQDAALKKEVVLEVTKRIEAFAKQVEKAVASTPQPSRPDPNVRSHFPTEGIPETGTVYTVEPGDNLATIARKFSSRADWIQNINKISDPRLLQAGQVIFVPQRGQ